MKIDKGQIPYIIADIAFMKGSCMVISEGLSIFTGFKEGGSGGILPCEKLNVQEFYSIILAGLKKANIASFSVTQEGSAIFSIFSHQIHTRCLVPAVGFLA